MRILFAFAVVLAGMCFEAKAALPSYQRNPLTTNNITLGAGLSLSAGDVLSASGVGNAPGGNSGAVQFNEGAAFAGTNDLNYDRTNRTLNMLADSFVPGIRINAGNGVYNLGISASAIIQYGSGELRLGVGGNTNWAITAAGGHFGPAGLSNTTDIAAWHYPLRTNYANDFVAKETISVAGGVAGGLILSDDDSSHSFRLASVPVSHVNVTNLVGIVETNYAAVMVINANEINEYSVTNRASAANTSLILSNTAPGQTITAHLIGEIAGGTSRTVTMIANLGQLVANMDTYGSALATSMTVTLTNGNALEISDRIMKQNGTNIHKIVTRQYAF